MGATHQGRGEEALAAQDNPIFVDERDNGGNLAPSKASFCRFDIRRASTPPATASAQLRLSFVMRYIVRMGIQNWMVWDRKTHRPAMIDKKLAVKLSKNEASELAAALNTLPADGPSFHPSQPATPLQPLRRRRKVKRSALRI